MPTSLKPGFIALHGNRSEELAQAVIAWLAQHPLAPLEQEVVLVQSNGIAEWFKMELAQQLGVCGSTRVELPGRFLWRSYRELLGPRAVPRDSPLDKLPMTWRLMQVLPGLLATPAFEPVRRYLRQDDPRRQLQLAQQLADLFDQYQNYRSDWLADWAEGRDLLLQAQGNRAPVPTEQAWQPELWRAVLDTLSETQRDTIRPKLHRQALERLNSEDDVGVRVARRVVVFGMSHMPASTLEALAALSRHSQVMLAIPNPCRYYWGDIMEGREFLRAERRRHALREGRELSGVSLEDMHQHAHPLLAAWGRQSRDFIRQLDAFDDADETRQRFPQARIDLFDESPEQDDTPLLGRVQNRIRDLEPLEPLQPDASPEPLPAADRSIVFHIGHSRVRELEILHDQLLRMLSSSVPGRPALQPRDVVVMVPDIELMAPAIRAVFGQYGRNDKRHVPFDIADLSAKSSSPIVTALEWLLQLPAQRCRISELVDLLEVPAVARRFGVRSEQLPQLTHWMSGAGIRWGLNLPQREQMGLQACGEQNSAWFGLHRMLLGYAAGSLADLPQAAGWAGIEPYAEVGGLDAELAGSLAHLLRALLDWWRRCESDATPVVWAERGRDLLKALFKPAEALDGQVLEALEQALAAWVLACEQAGFEQAVPLYALRQSWIEALDVPDLDKRFRAGGVTFCTLMPMRAVPFEVVCLLGMNDGDYPRRSTRSDFDLMGLAGQQRPGDRSRQQDDRQLMLEALLSARRTLYISWTGRNIRDNSVQPPSVLVSQLRDYLAAIWGKSCVESRTTEHPLQPFSRRYFERQPDAAIPLQTYAAEWRSLHLENGPPEDAGAASRQQRQPEQATPLTLPRLASFYRNPARAFFKERLGVSFVERDEEAADVEAFVVEGLDQHQLIAAQVRHWPKVADPGLLRQRIARDIERLLRSGVLPMQGFGELTRQTLQATLEAMANAWQQACEEFPAPAPRLAIEFGHDGVAITDWIDPLHGNAAQTAWLQLSPAKLLDKKQQPRPDKLLDTWLRSLAAAGQADRADPGRELHGLLVGPDATLRITPMAAGPARQQLGQLLATWREGMCSPLPLPLKTALALAGDGNAEEAYEGSAFRPDYAEVREMCLARCFPDFDALESIQTPTGESMLHALAASVYGPMLEWIDKHVSVTPHP
ncbi:exodeoxyribonuclease V subunit gamma [Malikia sp.]|uniref:exodeoxyribonuclease V subunit gamma n=1 Tax=Malikia sp. TaxID=2070706 RepID=UPI0026169BBE|nr:exodeoxyribonuclease V subunit gamma [Malikia sp.]MDD2727985.1 exodeoxyribonuclease V subunit gamma [Malikia sp.]